MPKINIGVYSDGTLHLYGSFTELEDEFEGAAENVYLIENSAYADTSPFDVPERLIFAEGAELTIKSE